MNLYQEGLLASRLHDEKTFYNAFIHDLRHCKEEVIIECPFITAERTRLVTPIFEKLLSQRVRIYIITRDPKEHYEGMEIHSEAAIRNFEIMGVQVLLCIGNHHRKLAILDRRVLWLGSLNILSQSRSREIMSRVDSQELATQMFNFLKLDRFI